MKMQTWGFEDIESTYLQGSKQQLQAGPSLALARCGSQRAETAKGSLHVRHWGAPHRPSAKPSKLTEARSPPSKAAPDLPDPASLT
jgi:hypothetical protein